MGDRRKRLSIATFDQMQSYVLTMYRGVRVTHSFIQNGNYFDCATSMTQSAVRLHHIARLASPPPEVPAPKLTGKAARSVLTPVP